MARRIASAPAATKSRLATLPGDSFVASIGSINLHATSDTRAARMEEPPNASVAIGTAVGDLILISGELCQEARFIRRRRSTDFRSTSSPLV